MTAQTRQTQKSSIFYVSGVCLVSSVCVLYISLLRFTFEMGPVLSSESVANAAYEGDRKTMKRLIKVRGIRDINRKVQIKKLVCAPMEFAVHGDHDNVVDALLKHLEHLPENELNRSLVLASDLGHLKVLKTLLDAQAIIEYSEPGFLYGHTAIVRAICNGHISVVSALLERQPTMNVKEEFILACQLGQLEILQMLLSTGRGDIACKQSGKTIAELKHPGCNALEYAIYAGRADVVEILLKHDNPKPAGMLVKALGVAIKEKKEEIVKMLTSAGADVKELFLTDGFEVLRGAMDTQNTFLLQELVQASLGATAKHDQLQRAVSAGHFEAARFLIIYGAETQLAHPWDLSKVPPRVCALLLETGAHSSDPHSVAAKSKKDFPLLLKRYKCPEARWEYRHIILCSRGVPARADWLARVADAEAQVVAVQAKERDYSKSEPQRKALDAVKHEEGDLLISQAEYDTLLDRRRQLVAFLDKLCETQEAAKDVDSLAITKHMRDSLNKLDLSMLPDNPYSGLSSTAAEKSRH